MARAKPQARASQPEPPAEAWARDLAVLNSIAAALNSATEVGQALEKTLALVTELLGLRTGWIWLLDSETQHFYLAAAQNLPPFLKEPVRMSGQACICTEGFRRGHLAPSNIEMLGCSRLAEAFSQRVPEAALGLRYHASIPLYFQDRQLGIINVTAPAERRLSDAELRLLSTIAYQVGIAVERARLADESTRLARAEERTRIAREIHDTLAQDLTAIGLDIEGALRHLDEAPERARERLQRALTTTRGSLEEARRSVLDLRGGPPAGRSLSDAVAALARAFISDTGVQVHLRSAYSQPLPLRIEAELYRIAQEALTNVRKHAGASVVEIDLRATPRDLVLSVQDDGAGFDPAVTPEEAQGLRGMRERVALLRGRLRLVSTPGNGTRITLRVPLPREDEM